ncbi:MAG: hypothetical protein UU72_C0037G0015 [candidate division WWE3 bacterium GW2011_GWB1_41_6]|uniref:Uncharacterized protein n=1 Tax=candidate division WWE3 bacterium GW2011_GWB1_41_6 TaxID=1619112 RepID=A0A0G0WTF1_UNCKA|nr:MAG: hypothetical protein UU72_C0037G0015 [candidate division WWE3 bacterium GW2011_GWB1_41_6]
MYSVVLTREAEKLLVHIEKELKARNISGFRSRIVENGLRLYLRELEGKKQ